MFFIEIWNYDTGFRSNNSIGAGLRSKLFSLSPYIQTLKKTQNALKNIDVHTDLFKKALEGASGILERIYLGKDNRSDNRQRIAQCFKDKYSQNLSIFLDPDKISQYSPSSLLYLMAHELEHVCQYQKNPIATLDDKSKPEEKSYTSDAQKSTDLVRDCVIETDAIAAGLGAFMACGGTLKEYTQLKKELPMLPGVLPEYDDIQGKTFEQVVNLTTQRILPWRWDITQDYLKKENCPCPLPQAMLPLLATNMVRAHEVFEAFITQRTKGEVYMPSPLRNGRN